MASVYEDDFDPEMDYRIREYLRRYDDLFAVMDDMQFNSTLDADADVHQYETHGPLFGTRDDPLVDIKAASYELAEDVPDAITKANVDSVIINYAKSKGTELMGGEYLDDTYEVNIKASCQSVRRLMRIVRALDGDVLLDRLVDAAHSGEKFHEGAVFDVEIGNTSIEKDEESGHFVAEIDLSIRKEIRS